MTTTDSTVDVTYLPLQGQLGRIHGGSENASGKIPALIRTGQVVGDTDQPIPGLYGVGNRVALSVGAGILGGWCGARPDPACAYRSAQAAGAEPATSLTAGTAEA